MKRRMTHITTALLGAAAFITAGCTSPPSVTPLLRIVDGVMREEAQRLSEESARDKQSVDQARRMLEAGFEADLRERGVLEAPWVRDAVAVYAAAREELALHEMRVAMERQQRATNLLAAASAQRRAIELIEGQDALLLRATGLDIWRLRWSPPGGATRSASPGRESGGSEFKPIH